MKHSILLRSKTQNQRVTIYVALFGLAATCCLVLACKAESCRELGFHKGERFRLTITGRDPDNPDPCHVLDLTPGTTFVLTAGDLITEPNPVVDCQTRAAAPETPSFGGTIVGACEPSQGGQLALACFTDYGAGC